MKTTISNTLRAILLDTALETESARSKRSLKRVKQMIKDAPDLISFEDALSQGNTLIAEIKERSPSQGKMYLDNVKNAPAAYKASRVVKAISVLTNQRHFGQGMNVERMLRIKEMVSKPTLRKDFITDAYQIYQARAFGADAVLLMANILTKDELCELSDTAFELGMDVLFETHNSDELHELPSTARIIGINCRNFNSSQGRFRWYRFLRQWAGPEIDGSVNTARFGYASEISPDVIKVAESGVTQFNCENVFSLGFNSALVGTSLLMDKRGVDVALADFERVILGSKKAPRKDAIRIQKSEPALA